MAIRLSVCTGVFLLLAACFSLQIHGGEKELHDHQPDWSPDGKKIAFLSGNAKEGQIYVMNADGSGLEQLTHVKKHAVYPAWSPDGKKLAFAGGRGKNWDIYSINADGTGLQRLTHDFDNTEHPTWSPDGKRIVFSSNHDSKVQGCDKYGWYSSCVGIDYDLYMMNSDGSDPTQITYFGDVADPEWSPDGTRILFQRGATLYVMAVDGTEVHRIIGLETSEYNSNPSKRFYHPSWSPDGQKITFAGKTGEGHQIFIASADGSAVQQLTHEKGSSVFPAWSPDGKKISFSSNRGRQYRIYVMNVDGSDVRQLSHL